MSNSGQRQQYQVEALEPRLLLSADGLGVGADSLQNETDPFGFEAADVIQEEWAGGETESAQAELESTSRDDLFADAEVVEVWPDLGDADESSDSDDLAATVLEDADDADPVSETTAAGVETVSTSVGEPIDLAAAPDLLKTLDSQIEGDPMAEALVMTLNAANGPPSAGTHIHLGDDNVQLTDNELVLGPQDRLSGTGSLSLSVIVTGGSVAPGNSPGILAVPSLTLSAGATTEIEIESNAGAGVGHDQIVVTGDVELGGTLDVTLLSGFEPAANDLYTILTWTGTMTGEFDNYLGTVVPGTELAFVPEVDAIGQEIRLRVVETESVVPEVDRALRDVSDLVDDLMNIPDALLDIPLIGSSFDDLIEAKDVVQDRIQNVISAALALTPDQSEITEDLENLHGTIFGNFTVEVDSVLGRYSSPGDPPGTEYGWDVKISLVENQVTPLIADAASDFMSWAFGAGSTVTLKNSLELDFGFGREATEAYLDIRSLTAKTEVTATAFDLLNFVPSWVGGSGVDLAGSATVTLDVSVTATPDPSVISGGRILSTAVQSLPNFATDFLITKAGSVEAEFVLDATLDNPLGLWAGQDFEYGGVHTYIVSDDDIFDMVGPDEYIKVDATGPGDGLIILGNTLKGVFELRADGASGDMEIAAVITELKMSVNFGGSSYDVLEATGTGHFYVEADGDTAGVATLTLPPGYSPPVPSVDELSGTYELRFNTATDEITVDTGGGMSETLMAGPYYRVEGNGTLELAIPDITVTGDFLFERQDPDAIPDNGDEVITVGVNDLAFSFQDLVGNQLVTAAEASGVLVFTHEDSTDGVVGEINDAKVSLGIPGLGGNDANSDTYLDGTFSVEINDFTTAYNETHTVFGTPVTVDVPEGPYVRVEGTGVTLNLDPGGLTGAPMDITGNFAFEQQTDSVSGDEVVTVGFNNVTLPFLDDGDNTVLTLTGLSGIFVGTKDGLAGEINASAFAFSIGGFSLATTGTSTLGLQVKTYADPVMASVVVGGVTQSIDLGADEFVKFIATDMSLTIGGFNVLTGDFGFEQRVSDGGTKMVTIVADDVAFNLGSALGNVFTLNNGHALFVINDGEVAGAGAIDLTVDSGISWFEINSGMAMTLDFGFNTDVADAVMEVFDWEGTPVTIDVKAGEHLEVSGGLNLALNFGTMVSPNLIELGGNFTFSQVKTGGGTVAFTGVKFEDLNFTLTAGALPIVGFHNGTGEFAFTADGVAGFANMEFDVGLIGMTGSMMMELNTTNAAYSTSLGGFNINVTLTEALHVCVNGNIQVGPLSLPADFVVEVDFVANTVTFSGKGGSTVMVSIDSSGSITHNLTLPSFDQTSEHALFSMLKQVILFLDLFKETSVFKTEIPFTNGVTVGDAFDFAQLFIDNVFAKMASVEVSTSLDIDGGGGVTLTGPINFNLTLGTGSPIGVSLLGGTFADIDALVAHFDAALPAGVTARKNKDGNFSISLEDAEIAKGTTLKLDFDDKLPHALTDLGFNTGMTGIETSRYNLADFVTNLATALDLTPPTFDPETNLYLYEDVTLDLVGWSDSWDFDFGALGEVAAAELKATIDAMADLILSFTLGYDLTPGDVPRLLGSPAIPVPSDGQLTEDAHFTLKINETETHIFTLLKNPSGVLPHTSDNTSVEDLADDLNLLFANAGLQDRIIAQKAGSTIAISALHEDMDGDGVLDIPIIDTNNDMIPDLVVDSEDTDGNGRLDVEAPGEDDDYDGVFGENEDLDGDGNLDVNEDALGNGDGNLDLQLGIITRLEVITEQDDVFANELGFNAEGFDSGGTLFYSSVSQAPIKGLFLEDVNLFGTLSFGTQTTGPDAGIDGSVRLGFLELSTVAADSFFNTTSDITVNVPLLATDSGDGRFFITELTNAISNVDSIIGDITFTGAFEAQLKAASSLVTLGTEPFINVLIPDINDLNYNSDPYDGSNTGTFVTLSGLDGAGQFGKMGFFDVINGLRVVTDLLTEMESFSFLNEKIPFVNMSFSDLLDWASKVGDLVEAVAENETDDIESMLEMFEEKVEELFNLDPSVFNASVDDTADPMITMVGPNLEATFNPYGTNNGLKFTTANTGLTDATIRILGSHDVSGDQSLVEWNAVTETLTVHVDPGKTTANAIITAFGAVTTPWSATLTEGGGEGFVTKTAIKFSLNYMVGYGDQIDLQFDVNDLLNQIQGDNSAALTFLQSATEFVTVSGDGMLDVAATATATLEFGLDITNPCAVTAFLYDTTGVVLEAEVLGSNLEFEASLGSVVGIFVRDGEVTFDADGDPDTEGKANVGFGLKDNNGDGRHYFHETIFSHESIGFTAEAGLTADLPIYAPLEGTPLDTDADDNGDGYPDNHLVVDIPDIIRVFVSDKAEADFTVDLAFRGDNNDFKVTGPNADFEVKFKQDPVVGTGASASLAGDTLTVTINSGQTTASSVISAIGGIGGYSAANLSGNDGTGKVAKITIITPDFGAMFDNLDLCAILDSSAGLLLDGLDSLLGTIQDGLESAANNIDLPLIGNTLGNQVDFIQRFRDGMLADVREALDANGGSATATIEAALKDVFWNSLGPGGLNVLVNEDGSALDPDQGSEQLDVSLDCDEGLIVDLHISWGLDLINADLDLDIGVPGFGLEVDGKVELMLGFDFDLGFGLNKEDGFYFDTSSSEEIVVGFQAAIPGLDVTGELFFLGLTVMDDPDAPSMFSGGLHVDIMDPNDDGKLTFAELTGSGVSFGDIVDADIEAVADINLKLSGGFGTSAVFPRVVVDFNLDWSWSLSDGATTPELGFNNLGIDLGTWISDFLGPILNKIDETVDPVRPIIEAVTAPIPILSDLAGRDINLLDVMESFGYLDPGVRKFIDVALFVIELADNIPTGANVVIPLGDFILEQSASGDFDTAAAVKELVPDDFLENAAADPEFDASAQASAGFAGDVGSIDNFSIPIWDNPLELMGLFTGKPVALIEWDMPTFRAEAQFAINIPIFGPLAAQFGGNIGVEINLGFGYDTFGIQKFIESNKVIDIFDGFYIKDFDSNGNDRDELRLYGEVFAGVVIDLFVAEVGVRGGLGLEVGFDLNDPNQDGRVRISEIISQAQIDPRCIFNIHGEIYVFLEAFLTVDLFFFKIEETWEFGRFTLFEFEITCPEPILAEQSGGTLTLNIGSRAADRLEIDTTDDAEHFTVTHLEGDGAGEKVEVAFAGYTAEFENVTLIMVEDAGNGNDIIDLLGVLAEVDIDGGVGNDTITLKDRGEDTDVIGSGVVNGGSGNDTITVTGEGPSLVLNGDAGNDTITAGKASVTINGGDGSDVITGTANDDELNGDAGSDTITAYAGNDIIKGGSGNDKIDADTGDDDVEGGEGADTIDGGLGNDFLDGGGEDDTLNGSAGNDILVGGPGEDSLRGHGGVDLLIGDTFDAFNKATLLTQITNIANGAPPASIDVNDIGLNDDADTAGDDELIGGGNYDILFGGKGDDFLFGGNFMISGETEVIEEDDNDFMDGGTGDDELFGDDAHGKTGDRDTGIEIRSSVWLDDNANGIRDESEGGLAGVEIQLVQPSAALLLTDAIVDTTVTDSRGNFKFTGLDPDSFFMVFESAYDSGTGAGLVLTLVNEGDNESIDSDANTDVNVDFNAAGDPNIGITDVFALNANESRGDVTAGFIGNSTISVADAQVIEGNNTDSELEFVVTLSRAVTFDFTIDYATAPGSAANNVDFTETSGTLTFEPGQQSRTIKVPVLGDFSYEGAHEGLTLQLSNLLEPANAGLPTLLDDTLAIGTIIEDDPIPALSINDSNMGNSEATDVTFTISLSNPSQSTITVRHQVVDSSVYDAEKEANYATLGADFQAVLALDELVTFLPGETEKTVMISTNDDVVDEHDEHFFVQLFDADKAVIDDGHGVGVISDDDDPVRVELLPVVPSGGDPHATDIVEGDSPQFEVRLLDPTGSFLFASEKEITVTYATQNGTAVNYADTGALFFLLLASPDYHSASASIDDDSSTLTFAPGDLTKTFEIVTVDDLAPEGAEQFFVNIIGADNADIEHNHGIVNIAANDALIVGNALSSVRFAEPFYSVEEGETAEITLVRSPGTSGDAVVIFTTQGITATGDVDYVEQELVVSFASGEYVKTIDIPTIEDTDWEGNETVHMSLRSPTGRPASASPFEATLTIVDDEPLPVVTLTPLLGTNTEGLAFGLIFNVTVTGDFQNNVEVDFQIDDLTTEAADYSGSTSGTLVFAAPGTQAVSLTITDDGLLEAPESLRVWIKNPVNAVIDESAETAIGTILDDETSSISGRVFHDKNGNGFFEDFSSDPNATYSEYGMDGVDVRVRDAQGTDVTVPTDADGVFTTSVHYGQVTIEVLEDSLTGSPVKGGLIFNFFSGFETTTDNDSQSIDFQGGTGLFLVEDIGYEPTPLETIAPAENSTVGRGGTDDTIFGGPGDDYIEGGAGDDHIVGGHWQTATNHYSPINLDGFYDAELTIFDADASADSWVLPLNGYIFGVDTSAMGNDATIKGTITESGSGGAEDIVVHLFDDKGNEVGVTLTDNSGNYDFQTFPGNYRVNVEIPEGWSEVTVELDPDTGTSYAIYSPASGGTETVDVELMLGAPAPASEGVTFNKPVYTVNQSEDDSLAIVTLTRGNAEGQSAVVYTLAADTAIAGTHYESVSGVVHFEVGELTETFVVPILGGGFIPECDSVSVDLTIRAATGRPLDESVLVIQHLGAGLTDNDLIDGGDDWDLILGDSGNIATHLQPARFLPATAPAGKSTGEGLDPFSELEFSGGPGADVIAGGPSFDFIFAQGGDDFLNGESGIDFLFAGMGDDYLIAELGNDELDGGHGFDYLLAEADADFTLVQNDIDPFFSGNDSLTLDFRDQPLSQSRFTLIDLEHTRLVGGAGANTFTLTDWSGYAEIEGDTSIDKLVVENDTDMTLVGSGLSSSPGLIASAVSGVIQTLDLSLGKGSGTVGLSDVTSLASSFTLTTDTVSVFNLVATYNPGLLSGFTFEQSSALTLGNGSIYSIDSVEEAHLIGGASGNKIDVSDYDGDVTIEGRGGDDELLGGPGDDTFIFLPTDTGNVTVVGYDAATIAADDPGFDTLDFSAMTQNLIADLSSLNTPTPLYTGAPISLIFEREDIDAVIGGDGDDDITGNARDNTLSGGPGDDSLAGGSGNEIYAFDADEAWGKETIFEDPTDLVGHDVLDFSATTGFPVIVDLNIFGTSPAADQVIGNLTLVIEAGGFEEVIGGDMDDEITGNGLDNTLRGGPGNDLLEGFGGDDFLDGGEGNDRLDGGPGFDSFSESENVDFTLTDTNVTKGTDYDVLQDVEFASLTGGALPNTFDLTGWTGSALIDGGGHGSDLFIQAANADFVFDDANPGDLSVPGVDVSVTHVGAASSDTISVVNVENFEITGGVSANTIDGSALSPLTPMMVARGNFTFDGAGGDDMITGTIWSDVLNGGADDDTITPLAGDDQVDGGTGTDMLIEQTASLGGIEFILDDAFLNSSAGVFSETDSLSGVEDASLLGGPGDDTFTVSEWTGVNVSLDGAGGTNEIYFSQDADMVLTDSAIAVGGVTTGISLANMNEVHLEGGASDNSFDASGFTAQRVIFHGDDGDDWFFGTTSNDVYYGDAGDDHYAFNADLVIGVEIIFDAGGSDTLDFSMTGTQGVTVDLGNAGPQPVAPGATLWLVGIQIENVIGGGGADQITGNAADNVFSGLGGADVFAGGGGVDRVLEIADADFTATDAALTIDAEIDSLLGIEELQLTGGASGNVIDASGFTGTTVLSGEGGGDTLRGGTGTDYLIGGADNDTLEGNTGDDFYVFDVDFVLGVDTISETGGSDTLDFSSTSSESISVDLEELALQIVHPTNLGLDLDTAASIENVIGGNQDDTIRGNAMVNRITGGPGNDELYGRGASDIVVETRDANFILTTTSLNIGTEIDLLDSMNRAILTGGVSNNTIDATAALGSVQLFGLVGNDLLFGGSGADILEGGAGNDDLFGGAGSDAYLFDTLQSLGSDEVFEYGGGGIDDLLIDGLFVDLTDALTQVISANLTLTLPNLNVENAL